MKITFASAVMFTVMLFALPVWAEERSLGESLLPLQPFDVGKATRFLEQLYRQGVEALEDHLEVEGTFQPDRNGERRGHLSLKLFPKGKSHSDEGIKAETWFGFANKPEEDHLHFDFKLSKEPKSTFSPQDYI